MGPVLIFFSIISFYLEFEKGHQILTGKNYIVEKIELYFRILANNKVKKKKMNKRK